MITQHAKMPATEATRGDLVDIEDQHRSSLYALLSNLLSRPPSKNTLNKVRSLVGGENRIGESINSLSVLSDKLDIKTIEESIIIYSLVWGGVNYSHMPVFI